MNIFITFAKKRLPKRLIKKSFSFVIFICVFIETILNLPFFLFRNRRLWHNKIIFPFYHWSFGHSITANDNLCRLFHPERISIIIIEHQGSNRHLFSTFHQSADLFYYTTILLQNNREALLLRYKYLKITFSLISAFCKQRQIIQDFALFYGVFSQTDIGCFSGDETADKKLTGLNVTGYARLIDNSIGVPLRLPAESILLCRNQIAKHHLKFFSRPFITILLRAKGINDSDFSNASRNTEQSQYREAIKYAVNRGFNVAFTGETRFELFADIPDVYNLYDTGIDPKLLNIFLITNCTFFVGQQSGPYALATAAGIPCLLVDCWPYRLASNSKFDINLFKKIEMADGTVLSMQDAFINHQDLCFGYGYRRKGAKIINNTSEEILQAIKERIYLDVNKNVIDPTTEELAKRLRKVVPNTMPFKYASSRPPKFILVSMEESLSKDV